MTNKKGLFITIEGVEGVGKSTNIASIKDYLENRNIEYTLSREPGGTHLSEKIRNLLLEIDEDPPCELSELLLIFAARAQHLETKIQPALDRGSWVVCDRFTDATYAYQGGGRGLNIEHIALLENLVQKDLRPDLTIILDLDPETGLQRAIQRGTLDRFEQEELAFFVRVRESYLDLAKNNPDRYAVIDASESIEDVRKALLLILETRLAKFG